MSNFNYRRRNVASAFLVLLQVVLQHSLHQQQKQVLVKCEDKISSKYVTLCSLKGFPCHLFHGKQFNCISLYDCFDCFCGLLRSRRRQAFMQVIEYHCIVVTKAFCTVLDNGIERLLQNWHTPVIIY